MKAVTYATIKITIFDILKEPEMAAFYGNPTENFKASFHWLTLFIKRYKLSLCQRIKADQRIIGIISTALEKRSPLNLVIYLI